jgi:hypothetical protein
VTPWQLPPEVALGLMMNLGLANAWKTVPVVQGVGLAFGGKDAISGFMPTLFGRTASVREQIAASFGEMRRSNDR